MGTLRMILALSVVMGHGLTTLFGVRLVDAAGAVWVFFSISGFLITIALSKKYTGGSLGLRSFYINRLIRIYPIYWSWLIISVLVYFFAPTTINYQIFRPDLFWSYHLQEASISTVFFAFLANLTGLFHDSFLRLGLDQSTGATAYHDGTTPWAMNFMFIGQYWSVGVEMIFYAIAPWVTKKIWRIGAVFAISSTGLLESWWIETSTHAGLPNQIVYMQTPKYIWMFMLGAALAHIYISINEKHQPVKTATTTLLILAMYLTIAFRDVALFPIQAFPWWLFVILTISIPILFHKTSKNKYDKFLGELSYPIYICHFLLIQVIGSIITPNGVAFAAACCATSIALVFLVDRPAKKLKISFSNTYKKNGDQVSVSTPNEGNVRNSTGPG
ncbi:acyltransferase family protein [Pseudomonas fluorescens]|uniref:acyltransferase family protein n=1 Tax=Pseudomonas fluorescens TaxID=294 RepID=UPI000B04B42B|nr:acyltransferase [Pseudomonas fluorescens]